jgi:DNA-binding beta-propeller fold protein YncE
MSLNRPLAPELSTDLEWVNTDGPIQLSGLRGKVVLLNFWAQSQLSAQLKLNDIRTLENKFDDGLACLSFSSPKFTAERSSGRLLKAVNRHFIRHPVANDLNFTTWAQFGVTAWPTVIVLDAEGQIAGTFIGEGQRLAIDELIGKLLDDAVDRDLRVYDPTPSVARPEPRYSLRFPSKVLALNELLYISDTGNNRILECQPEGRVMRIFGSGNAGFWDGSKQEAGFREPRGLAHIGEYLYVADSGNHAIRRIKLLNGEVETVIGTGEIGRRQPPYPADLRTLPIAAPWDLVGQNERLFIAMAGQHQILKYDLIRKELSVYAGSGRIELRDGEGVEASFAQPQGLALSARTLYVVDSESSSVRSIRLADGRVSTLIGSGLYQFGDRDGPCATAQLQQPRAVVADDSGSVLWIADAYNDKLKMIDVRQQTVSTLNLGFAFSEPSGLSRIGDKLYVADTHAHHVVEVNLRSGRVEPVAVVD